MEAPVADPRTFGLGTEHDQSESPTSLDAIHHAFDQIIAKSFYNTVAPDAASSTPELAMQPSQPAALDVSKEVDHERKEMARIMLDVVSGDLNFADIEAILEPVVARTQTDQAPDKVSEHSNSPGNFDFEFTGGSYARTKQTPEKLVAALHNKKAGWRSKLGATLLAIALSVTAACGRSAPSEEGAPEGTTTTIGFIKSDEPQSTSVATTLPSYLPDGATPTVIDVQTDMNQTTSTTTGLTIATPSDSSSVSAVPTDTSQPAAAPSGEQSPAIDIPITQQPLGQKFECSAITAPRDGITHNILQIANNAQIAGLLPPEAEYTGSELFTIYLSVEPALEAAVMPELYTSDGEYRIKAPGEITYPENVCRVILAGLLKA